MKIADSAAIRQKIPTGPREGNVHWLPIVVAAEALLTPFSQVSIQIRIFRMLQVPQRATTRYRGNLREVVFGRRRRRRPFERPGIPRIIARQLSGEKRPQQVPNENKNPAGLKENSDRDN